ncbi:hypothetical protein [Natronomonas sp. LN261]|uniref:hypothetical protein n=1 Tax=Natronomonas sp. LN261 TaxID=2750669 RepID=UPI0015EE9303|nr:hypothetical protein [Natronomonas sp. LN261]
MATIDDPESMLPDNEEDVDDRRPSATAFPVRPALEVLQLDQRELIDVSDPRLEERPTPEWDLRRGVPHRRALIEWYQRATVRTLGRFADSVPPESLLRDDVFVASLTGASEHAKQYRGRLEDDKLIPATTAAYDELRGGAGEYIEVFEDDSDFSPMDFDPERQANVAMRPGFSYIDRIQQSALSALWGGFEDRDALRDWLHDLSRATNGQHESELSKRVMGDANAVACLTNRVSDEHGRGFRERFAIKKLLPSFAAAVESMETGELAKRRKTTAQTYQFG